MSDIKSKASEANTRKPMANMSESLMLKSKRFNLMKCRN